MWVKKTTFVFTGLKTSPQDEPHSTRRSTVCWTCRRRTSGSGPPLRTAQPSAKAMPRVGPSLMSWTAWSKARDQKVAEQTPPWEAHPHCTGRLVEAVVVGHVAVKEVVIVPSDDPGVSTNPTQATVDMGWDDGVKGTADVQKYCKAVGAAVDVPFNIVRERGGSRLLGLVAAEAVLLHMEGGEADTLLDCTA